MRIKSTDGSESGRGNVTDPGESETKLPANTVGYLGVYCLARPTVQSAVCFDPQPFLEPDPQSDFAGMIWVRNVSQDPQASLGGKMAKGVPRAR